VSDKTANSDTANKGVSRFASGTFMCHAIRRLASNPILDCFAACRLQKQEYDGCRMKPAIIMLSALMVAPTLALAQPAVSAVLNAASYDAIVSPGCWAVIFGSNLAAAPVTAATVPLPPVLGGVSVTIAGLPASLLYVSPTQINVLIPLEVQIPVSTVVPMVVTSAAGATSYNIRLTRNAPAIFTRNGSGTGRALVFSPTFQAVDTIAPNDLVVLYAAGLGLTSTANTVADEVEVYLGERKAQVLFAGLAPGLPGIYQLNVRAPALASDRLYIRSGGWQSNIVDIGINRGANISNARGLIDGLYPSSDPGSGLGSTFSIMLHAGTFSVDFDINPSAGAFEVAAVGEAGGVVISVDPGASCVNEAGVGSRGQYTAAASTLTETARRGDFSGSIVPLWDYSTCDPRSWECLAFPLSTIPPARLGDLWRKATDVLPAASFIVSPGPNAFQLGIGCLADLPGGSGRFVVNAQTNRLFSTFGGIIRLPLGTVRTRVSRFKLYVDGVLVSSKDVGYGAPYTSN
jgi:uncharacterized protein (TIGR03437 family)